jgi:hypothetical protein
VLPVKMEDGSPSRVIETGYTMDAQRWESGGGPGYSQGCIRFSTDEARSWSVPARVPEWNGVSEVVSASMRKGVLDSFLLRSLVGGNLRLELPRGWSSAQVARVDEAQETIEIKRLPNGEAEKNKEAPGVIEFQTEAGGSYLIGPVW